MIKQTTSDMAQTSENVYVENGFESRNEYLIFLSEEYGAESGF